LTVIAYRIDGKIDVWISPDELVDRAFQGDDRIHVESGIAMVTERSVSKDACEEK
jgi:hypothetical protein